MTKGRGHPPAAKIQQRLAVTAEQSTLTHKRLAEALERQAHATEETVMSMGEVRDSLNTIMQHMLPHPGSAYPEWPGIRSRTVGLAAQAGSAAESGRKCQRTEEIINLCEDDDDDDDNGGEDDGGEDDEEMDE
jgi:hypothetical protein